jgi:hypothetical protein
VKARALVVLFGDMFIGREGQGGGGGGVSCTCTCVFLTTTRMKHGARAVRLLGLMRDMSGCVPTQDTGAGTRRGFRSTEVLFDLSAMQALDLDLCLRVASIQAPKYQRCAGGLCMVGRSTAP